MASILLLWAFGSFVLFKVVLDVAFSRDVTVTASLLLGIMVAISVFASGYFYATKMGVHLAKIRLGRPSSFFGSAFSVWLVTALLNVGVGKAIVFGFSKKFNREFGGDLLFQGSYNTDEGILFSMLIIIPVTLHFISVLFGVSAQTRAVIPGNET